MCSKGNCNQNMSEIERVDTDSTSDQSEQTIWVGSNDQPSPKYHQDRQGHQGHRKHPPCHDCGYNRNACRCRRQNIRVMPCLPHGAIPISRGNKYPSGCSSNDNIEMQVPVNPMQGLVGLGSGLNNGYIMVNMRCKDDVVTFQWEPFKGQLGANNIKYVTMNASLGNLPIYKVQFPIRVEITGDHYDGYLAVDNTNSAEVYKFHFKTNNSINGKLGDSVEFKGGAVTWIKKK